MIYVDMKCFSMKKTLDVKLDEDVLVSELLKEMEKYFFINKESSQIVSTRNKQVLSKKLSLKQQGVLGGDTLILVEGEK